MVPPAEPVFSSVGRPALTPAACSARMDEDVEPAVLLAEEARGGSVPRAGVYIPPAIESRWSRELFAARGPNIESAAPPSGLGFGVNALLRLGVRANWRGLRPAASPEITAAPPPPAAVWDGGGGGFSTIARTGMVVST